MEDFKKLISLLNITNIQILESHETVLKNIDDSGKLNLNSNQQIAKGCPKFIDNELFYQLKYDFTFSSDNEPYFNCVYVIGISFLSTNIDEVKDLLSKDDVKDLFTNKQLNKTMWSILRGTVLDAFNRHSLSPVPLPWIY